MPLMTVTRLKQIYEREGAEAFQIVARNVLISVSSVIAFTLGAEALEEMLEQVQGIVHQSVTTTTAVTADAVSVASQTVQALLN